jgi:nodulation protein E
MTARRVAVTGVGVVSALGADRAAFWRALAVGRPGIGPIRAVDCSDLRFSNGAEARDYDPSGHFEPKALDSLDRFSQLALVAAREAAADAGFPPSDGLPGRTAVVTGSSLGGQTTEDAYFHELYAKGRNRVPPLSIPRVMANAATSAVTMELGLTGPAFTLSTACSSANHALGLALWMVRQGTCDCAFAGGSEAPFSRGNLKAWEALRAVSPDTCRPFSRDRSGLILGEGAAFLVLEPLDAARERGARIYAEIAGFGMSADASHLTQPSVAGAATAMRAALADAALAPEEVGYVNAHGTGTAANDPCETRALREVFGAHAERLAVSSTKSMHGHALGAAGALEAAATVLALAEGVLPPTANFTAPDPECDLDVIPNEARAARVAAALSNSFAFGGLNAVLAFRSADAEG